MEKNLKKNYTRDGVIEFTDPKSKEQKIQAI